MKWAPNVEMRDVTMVLIIITKNRVMVTQPNFLEIISLAFSIVGVLLTLR